MKKLLLLAALSAPVLVAQLPTYNLDAPFTCDQPQTQPPVSFYYFTCRGVSFTNPTTGERIQLFWFNVLGFYVSPCCTLGLQGTRKTKVDADGHIVNGQPQPFSVEFQYQTTDGLFHYGIWSGTWKQVPGFRGQKVEITSGDLQFDSSTVAILD